MSAPRTLLLNSTLVDPLDDAPRRDCAVLIEDGRIAAVGDQDELAAAAGDCATWDLGGAYCCPV